MGPLASLRRVFAATPLNALLGLELHHANPEGAEVRMPVQASFAQETGVVHGGLLTSLADTAAVYALLPSLPDGQSLIGIDVKLNFLRSAAPDGKVLVARARPVRLGRRVGVARVTVLQEEREVALGLFTYLVIPAGEG